LARNVENRVAFWSSSPDSVGGAYDIPPNPLTGKGFLPPAIAASQDLPPLEIKSRYASVYRHLHIRYTEYNIKNV